MASLLGPIRQVVIAISRGAAFDFAVLLYGRRTDVGWSSARRTHALPGRCGIRSVRRTSSIQVTVTLPPIQVTVTLTAPSDRPHVRPIKSSVYLRLPSVAAVPTSATVYRLFISVLTTRNTANPSRFGGIKAVNGSILYPVVGLDRLCLQLIMLVLLSPVHQKMA